MDLFAILNLSFPHLVCAKSSTLWAPYWFDSPEPHTTHWNPVGSVQNEPSWGECAGMLTEVRKRESAPCVKFTFSMFYGINLEDYKIKEKCRAYIKYCVLKYSKMVQRVIYFYNPDLSLEILFLRICITLILEAQQMQSGSLVELYCNY